jgi:NAD(P)-dependent dehydrogenase (short-subunit alcohol dehydrogenase family)
MTSGPLSGKVALVTGGGSGIGKAISLTLAKNGAAVALVARKVERLKAAKAEIEAFGGTAEVFLADIGDVSQCVGAVRDAVARFGRLDILVNDAAALGDRSGRKGIGPQPLAETTAEDWDWAYSVTVRGTFMMCKEAIPHLSKQPRAFIVNIGTVSTRKAEKGNGIYTATKNAMRGMSVVLSKELRETTGIRVHIVHPGVTRTGIVTDTDVGTHRPDLVGAKLVAPEEIADVVLFLVTRTGNGMIDEIYVRREDAPYWCFS